MKRKTKFQLREKNIRKRKMATTFHKEGDREYYRMSGRKVFPEAFG